MRLLTLSLSLVIGSTLVLSSCKKVFIPSDEDSKYNTFKGPQVELGNGHARTFATISHTGVPQEVGVVFTDKALSGLPTAPTLYYLEFHKKAIEATLFEQVVFGLSPQGHPMFPSGSIGPHFDVRFFMMTEEERQVIPAPPAPGFNAPPPGYLPPNFVMNVAVAKLGRHWNEAVTTPGTMVNHAMTLGTWNGELTFINPNVTLTTFASGQSYSVAYPQPQFFAKHGYYATKYNIYEDDKGNHYITLSAFVWR
jgi:hypothetical protein